MARNPKNKFPADKTGTKYSEFRNTKRVSPGKVRGEKDPGQRVKQPDEASLSAADRQS